jgi:serine/threonine protein kinase
MNQLFVQTIGRYRITEQLGQGGMAVVYKAFDTQLERDVAIKLIRVGAFPPDFLDHVLERFKREAKTLARLNHPNIVKVHDFGEIDGAPFLVMDYLSGHTFKEIRKPIRPEAAARLLLPIAEALSYAHSQGVFHRDIKPSNIILNNNQSPILMDFGISKLLEEERGYTLTGTGIGLGTPEYMAPEQGLGKAIDGRADLYSMGIVFYELITGNKPYQANTAFAVLYKQMSDPLPDPRQFVTDLSDEVEQFLVKALAKKPVDRYSDMEEFKKGLSSLISNKQTSQELRPQDNSQPILQLENTFEKLTQLNQ